MYHSLKLEDASFVVWEAVLTLTVNTDTGLAKIFPTGVVKELRVVRANENRLGTVGNNFLVRHVR